MSTDGSFYVAQQAIGSGLFVSQGEPPVVSNKGETATPPPSGGHIMVADSKSQEGEVLTSTSPSGGSMHSSPWTPGSTIEVATVTHQDQLHTSSKSPLVTTQKYLGKKSHQYVMPDGSVVSGKGLGRGRPGIKRGPRKSKLGSEMTEGSESTVDIPNETAPVKRKRADSGDIDLRVSSSTSPLSSRESTPEYNPVATQTRSGRAIQKPVSITAPTRASPAISAPATLTPAPKRPSLPSNVPTPTKTHPKIKRKIYRGREQFALCEHCLRSFGPPGNLIVFCDACNKCWHQRCHTPKIPKEVVLDTKAEWFCADCDRILHGKKKQKVIRGPTPASAPVSEPIQVQAIAAPKVPPAPRYGPPLVGGAALSSDQRVHYLQTLSKERLLALVLRAADLAPDLPIFETLSLPPPIHQLTPAPEPQFASTYVTPVDKGSSTADATAPDTLDEGYDDAFDEYAALYPQPGEGVSLPPDSADLHMLLEGPNSKTFSHWIRGMPMKAIVDTTTPAQ